MRRSFHPTSTVCLRITTIAVANGTYVGRCGTVMPYGNLGRRHTASAIDTYKTVGSGQEKNDRRRVEREEKRVH